MEGRCAITSVRWGNGANLAKWNAGARTIPRATRSTANVCVPAAGQVIIVRRNVLPTGTGKSAARSVVVETVEAAIISLASATAHLATRAHSATICAHRANTATNVNRSANAKTAALAIRRTGNATVHPDGLVWSARAVARKDFGAKTVIRSATVTTKVAVTTSPANANVNPVTSARSV